MSALLWGNAAAIGLVAIAFALDRTVRLRAAHACALWRAALAVPVLVAVCGVCSSALNGTSRPTPIVTTGASATAPTAAAASMPSRPVARTAPALATFQQTASDAVATIWVLGFALFAVRTAYALVAVEILRRRRLQARPSARTRAVCDTLPGGRGVPVHVSPAVGSPSVIGYLRPSIVIPMSLEPVLSADGLRQVLLHELCHVRCKDNIWALFERFASALYWCNPATAYAVREIDHHRERRCDDAAKDRDTVSYMRTLLFVSQFAHAAKRVSLGSAAAERPSRLERRMNALASDQPTRGMPRTAIATMLALAACFAWCASLAAPAFAWPRSRDALISAADLRSLSYFAGTWTCHDAGRSGRVIGIATFSRTSDGLVEHNESVGGTWTYRSTSTWRQRGDVITVDGSSNVGGPYHTESRMTAEPKTAIEFTASQYRNVLTQANPARFASLTSAYSHGRWFTVENAVCDRDGAGSADG